MFAAPEEGSVILLAHFGMLGERSDPELHMHASIFPFLTVFKRSFGRIVSPPEHETRSKVM